MMMYDLCPRREHCGIYMPGHYWKQHGACFKFTCQIQWTSIRDKEPEVAAKMDEKYGTNVDLWPQPGCGARVRPWRSMKIVEIRMPDGAWRATMAEPVPHQLADLIRDDIFEWNVAAGQATTDEILKVAPSIFQEVHPTGAPGVSKFDLQEWISRGKPTMTASCWVSICAIIAKKNYRVLGHIYDECCQMEMNIVIDACK